MKQPPDVRSILLSNMEHLVGKHVSLMLSGGIDPMACLYALRELGCKITAVTFMLDGILSEDFNSARRAARKYSVDFFPVFLKTDLDMLVADIRKLIRLGAKTKAQIECGWPLLHAFDQAPSNWIVMGLGADGHFCISKKGMIHFKHRVDAFRKQLYGHRGQYKQAVIPSSIANHHSKMLFLPFLDKRMREGFRGTTWDQINRPKQKQTIIDAFPEFRKDKPRHHQNYQLGDTGIADNFTRLVQSQYNRVGARTVVGIYNAMVREARSA